MKLLSHFKLIKFREKNENNLIFQLDKYSTQPDLLTLGLLIFKQMNNCRFCIPPKATFETKNRFHLTANSSSSFSLSLLLSNLDGRFFFLGIELTFPFFHNRMTVLVSASLSCRVTLRPVRMRLRPSGTTTGFCSASANTSTTPSSMGKKFTSLARREPLESLYTPILVHWILLISVFFSPHLMFVCNFLVFLTDWFTIFVSAGPGCRTSPQATGCWSFTSPGGKLSDR